MSCCMDLAGLLDYKAFLRYYREVDISWKRVGEGCATHFPGLSIPHFRSVLHHTNQGKTSLKNRFIYEHRFHIAKDHTAEKESPVQHWMPVRKTILKSESLMMLGVTSFYVLHAFVFFSFGKVQIARENKVNKVYNPTRVVHH